MRATQLLLAAPFTVNTLPEGTLKALADHGEVYDNNRITIEGKTRITFTEDVGARFLAYGWNVLRVGNATTNIRRRNIGIASCRRTSKCVLRRTRRRPSDGSDTSAGRAGLSE